VPFFPLLDVRSHVQPVSDLVLQLPHFILGEVV
jgi:hypothetical protein